MHPIDKDTNNCLGIKIFYNLHDQVPKPTLQMLKSKKNSMLLGAYHELLNQSVIGVRTGNLGNLYFSEVPFGGCEVQPGLRTSD